MTEVIPLVDAFAQAIAHHQAGRLPDAERLYRAVLDAQPQHTDANHNMGALAVQIGKPEVGLPYFKAALEADPSQGQYWLSYIDALLQVGQHGDARQVLAQGRQGGLAGPAVEALALRADATLKEDEAFAVVVAHHQAGRLVEAEEGYRQVLALNPQHAAALSNLAFVLHFLGRLEEAEASCRRALEVKPDFSEAHSILGNVLRDLGRMEGAEASYRQALELKPDFAEAHSNLGNALRDLGRLEEAVASYRLALEIKPNYAEAHNNLGTVLRDLDRLGEAEASYRRALEIKPDYAEAHSNLGIILQSLGRLEEAVASCRKALHHEPMLISAHSTLSRTLRTIVPSWHLPMMNDTLRNDAYLAALRSAVTPESTVLDIGTGSGLLAMMAARLGARQVTTCEAVPLIAATAQNIVAHNGLALSVRVISKKSTKLEVGIDLPERANLLVSEIFSSELLGEGVLPSIEDAKCRLLTHNARIIPAKASIVFALFEGEKLSSNTTVGDVCGFDLSEFNNITSSVHYVHRNDLDIKLLSNDMEAFIFDYTKDNYFPAECKTLKIKIREPGRCYGIIQWIRLYMDDNDIFENNPSVKFQSSGWQQCIHRFLTPIDVKPDQIIEICAKHDRYDVRFFVALKDVPE